MEALRSKLLFVWVFVLLAGVAPAVLGETVVYDNSDPCGMYYAPGSSGFIMIADDMNLAGSEMELVRYSFHVNSPSGTSPYNVTSELYTDAIDPCTGYPIPDTPIAGTYCAHVVNSDGYLTVNCTPSGATLPDRVWMVLSFDAPVAGWEVSGAAEVGETGDYFALHDGVSWGPYWFDGDPYAGFEAKIWCGQSEVCDRGDYINPGMDLWTCPDSSFVFGGGAGGCISPIPADFFGPGSDPFEGQVACKGDDPVSDARTERTSQGHVPPPYPASDPIDIELVELSLKSVAPITITYNGGMNPELWDVEVDLSAMSPPPGTLNATKTHCNGGTYTALLPVLPRFTFIKVADPCETQVLDTGLEGLPVIDLNSVGPCPWENTPDGNDFRPSTACPLDLGDTAGVCTMTLIASEMVTDDFWVRVDLFGEAVGGGSGYNDGEWYYYPNTDWWNQWFYDHPFDPDRKKIVDVWFTIRPMDPCLPSWAKVAYNWATPDWYDPCRPPLPPLDPNDEDVYIGRSIFFDDDLAIRPQIVEHHFEIEDYNPEWISIDVNGFNFEITEGRIDHACLPKPGCFPRAHPDYSEWVFVGEPDCWCYPRQCHGDADGLPYGAKTKYWVSIPDLTILKNAWNKPLGSLVGNEICADFDHLPYGAKTQYRVSIPDLTILKGHWNIPDGPDPNCFEGY